MQDRKKIVRATTIPRSLVAFSTGVLRELQAKYDVIAISSPGPELEEIKKSEGVITIAVPMERHISLMSDWRSFVKMRKVFKEEKPYMVHSMTPKAGLICMMAAKAAKVPIRIHTFTGLVWPTSTGIKRELLKLTDRITCFCATHIIPEGQGVLNDLREGRITRKPLKVLGYGNVRGVDMQYYSRSVDVLEKAGSIRDDSIFTFLFVGRIVRDKGVNELVCAFKRLKQVHPNIRLFLIGKYENELNPISSETDSYIKSDESIIATGALYDKDLLSYYAASDCFVFPSYREGFPNTVLEAGAMGLPSIVTDINGSREIIVEGKNGIIVPPRDEERLYNAMKTMMQSPVNRQKMAREARKMIADRFEQGYVRQCLYDFYDNVLNKK